MGRKTDSPQYRAHQAVARAIRGGDLQRPASHPCKDCGGVAVEYDHRDYSKPLAVDPVCRRCNLRRGAAIGWRQGDNQRPATQCMLIAIREAKGNGGELVRRGRGRWGVATTRCSFAGQTAGMLVNRGLAEYVEWDGGAPVRLRLKAEAR